MAGLLDPQYGIGDIQGLLAPYIGLQPGAPLGRRYGADERMPYDSERKYFKANPHVAGMAAEDNRVVMNPYGLLGPREQDAVRMNEAARIWMRNNGGPRFALTPEQTRYLGGTTYAGANENDRRATIAARLLSGDPSAGAPTPEQQQYVEMLRRALGQ